MVQKQFPYSIVDLVYYISYMCDVGDRKKSN